ncbi:MAG: CHAT domain-containing protein [Cyanobacteriota bacterium]|nr:CHAT domain-containing protein [Cyanobacteriota bacterium]
MTHEFLISVTPVGEQKYLVRTERVAPGVPLAEEQVSWPVEDWLRQARQNLNDPVLDLLQGRATPEPNTINEKERETKNLVTLGQELYRGLLDGALRDSWNCAQSVAHNRSEVLHLRLGLKGLKDRRLPQLPWEIMHRGDRPLATGTDVVFSRYEPSTSLLGSIRKVPANEPLKILMAIAAPSDRESLELEREYEELKEELRDLNTGDTTIQQALLGAGSKKRQIQLDIIRQPGREELTQALERGQYQVFHYAGHSNWGTAGGEIDLVSRETGLTESLSGDDIAGLLVNNGIQVAVFNSCRGAYSELGDRANGETPPNLAEAIVNRGVPGVLAMAERIPDGVSIALTRLFYRNLVKGSASVVESLSRARQGLVSAYGSEQLYWALPVLYVHSKFDGYLLGEKNDVPNSEDAKKRSAESVREWKRHQKMALYSKLGMLPEADSDEGSEGEDIESMPELLGGDRGIMALSSQLEMLPEADSGEGADFDRPINDDLEEELELPVYKLGAENDDRLAEDSALVAELFGQVTNSLPPQGPPAGGAIALNSSQKGSLAITGSRENTTKPPKTHTRKKNFAAKIGKSRWRNPLAVGFSLVAAAAVGTWFSLLRGPQPGDLLPSLPPKAIVAETHNLEPTEGSVDLDTTPTGEVTAIAIELFNQNNLSAAKLAVESLLDRGALPEAKAALAVVPPELSDESAILFLQGRLAWEFVGRGNDNYSIDDARRYWQSAVKQNPVNIEYLNALGFALYAEGRFIQAYQVWEQVTDMLNASGKVHFLPTSSTTTSSAQPSFEELESLNASAGIGLVLMKSAEELPPEERSIRLSKAIKFRQKVISDAPVNFQALELSHHWMWSENAIRDWQLLLRM